MRTRLCTQAQYNFPLVYCVTFYFNGKGKKMSTPMSVQLATQVAEMKAMIEALRLSISPPTISKTSAKQEAKQEAKPATKTSTKTSTQPSTQPSTKPATKPSHNQETADYHDLPAFDNQSRKCTVGKGTELSPHRETSQKLGENTRRYLDTALPPCLRITIADPGGDSLATLTLTLKRSASGSLQYASDKLQFGIHTRDDDGNQSIVHVGTPAGVYIQAYEFSKV